MLARCIYTGLDPFGFKIINLRAALIFRQPSLNTLSLNERSALRAHHAQLHLQVLRLPTLFGSAPLHRSSVTKAAADAKRE